MGGGSEWKRARHCHGKPTPIANGTEDLEFDTIQIISGQEPAFQILRPVPCVKTLQAERRLIAVANAIPMPRHAPLQSEVHVHAHQRVAI